MKKYPNFFYKTQLITHLACLFFFLGCLPKRQLSSIESTQPPKAATAPVVWDVRLSDVPYFSQIDNKYEPKATCNNSSLAMVLQYIANTQSADYVKLANYTPDSIYKSEGKLNDGTKIVSYVSSLNKQQPGVLQACHTKRGSKEMIKAYLKLGVPVILQNNFSQEGHFVVIDGYSESAKKWSIQDPWGEWTTRVQSSNEGSEYSLNKRINAKKNPEENLVHKKSGQVVSVNKVGQNVAYSYESVGRESTDNHDQNSSTYWITMIVPKAGLGSHKIDSNTCQIKN